MEECHRNQEISASLCIWEWCSKTLHVKWERKRKNRNGCLMALAYAISESDFISPFKLPKIYTSLPRPLLTEAKILKLWAARPVPLLDLALGCFTRTSPLQTRLDQWRIGHENNAALDKLAKKMRARERRFGSDWFAEGHHPEEDFLSLKEATAPLHAELSQILAHNYPALEELALEVLAQGAWQFGELPAACWVRRTPLSLLNGNCRLKLWKAAHEVLARGLGDEERLETLCSVLAQAISPALKISIENQGYSVDQVIDDMLNFDMHKTREEIAQ